MKLSDHVFVNIPGLVCGQTYQISLTEIRTRHEVAEVQLIRCTSCDASIIEQLVPLSARDELDQAWSRFLTHVQGTGEIR